MSVVDAIAQRSRQTVLVVREIPFCRLDVLRVTGPLLVTIPFWFVTTGVGARIVCLGFGSVGLVLLLVSLLAAPCGYGAPASWMAPVLPTWFPPPVLFLVAALILAELSDYFSGHDVVQIVMLAGAMVGIEGAAVAWVLAGKQNTDYPGRV